jgi:hypothetical protein
MFRCSGTGAVEREVRGLFKHGELTLAAQQLFLPSPPFRGRGVGGEGVV